MTAARKIIRVFVRRTAATPDDPLAYVGGPTFDAEADEIHVSAVFTWDLPEADRLAKEWERVAPVKIGGPATGMRGEEFTPGLYMKRGYTITSRGCPNRCWFCSVWKRDGTIRELPIVPGWRLNDDNLLACSEPHIRAVFAMLQAKRAAGHKIEIVGGLEAARLQPYHVDLLAALKPYQVFFAYDGPEDLEPLRAAGKMLVEAGLKSCLRAYLLCMFPGDTVSAAERRMVECYEAGFLPFAMIWKNGRGETATPISRRLHRRWFNTGNIRLIAKGLGPRMTRQDPNQTVAFIAS